LIPLVSFNSKVILLLFFIGVFLIIGFVAFIFYIDFQKRKKEKIKENESLQWFLSNFNYEYLKGCTSFGKRHLRRSEMTQMVKFSAGNCVRFAQNGVTLRSFIWTQANYQQQGETRRFYHVLAAATNLDQSKWLGLRLELPKDLIEKKVDKHYLDFESKEFNKTYYVTASPRKFGYEFFNPRMIQLFMQNQAFGSLVRDGYIILYREVECRAINRLNLIKDFRVYQSWIESSTDIMFSVLRLLPHYLIKFHIREEAKVKKPEVHTRTIELKKRLKIECTVCYKKFHIPRFTDTVECPRCGVTGTLSRDR